MQLNYITLYNTKKNVHLECSYRKYAIHNSQYKQLSRGLLYGVHSIEIEMNNASVYLSILLVIHHYMARYKAS